eukprot:529425-Amphidinium_carterae.1
MAYEEHMRGFQQHILSDLRCAASICGVLTVDGSARWVVCALTAVDRATHNRPCSVDLLAA